MGNITSIPPDRSKALVMAAGDTNVQVRANLRGRTILRSFTSPNLDTAYKVEYFMGVGSLALSNERIVGHGATVFGSKGLILYVPWDDSRARQVQFALEGDRKLLVKADAKLFNPEWTGQVEYEFVIGDNALKWFERIQQLQQNVPKAAGEASSTCA